MVSRDNVIEINTKCSCGNGDTENPQKNYFENKCPNCKKEGKLVIETMNNMEVSSGTEETDNQNTTDTTNENTDDSPTLKIVCKGCEADFCGQDGYDLNGGLRGSLTSVNPNQITDEDEGEASSTEEGETTYMSGWEGLCDLLKPLDGQAMMVQRGDYVIIKKIDMPQSARLWAYEGINVVDDSVSITDYTPEIYNTFIIRWGESYENELEFIIDNHKKLFGERKIVIEAKKISVVGEEEEEEEEDNSSGGIFDMLFGSNNDEDKNKNEDNTPEALGSDIGVGNTERDEEAPETEEIPITDRDEAIRFGLTEVGKAKREDGHTVELKVIGNTNWQMGEWCHVKLPSFNEDSYMFISKCSFETSPDSEFIHSLTLVDYPPSLGKPSKIDSEGDGEDSGTGTGSGSEAVDTISKEISEFSYASGCSDAECIKKTKKGDCWALSDYIYNRLKDEGVTARVVTYVTESADNHRQVEYKDGSDWVMFPYSQSGIDHMFYTNEIPSNAKVVTGG